MTENVETKENLLGFSSVEELASAYESLKTAYDELVESQKPECEKGSWQEEIDTFLTKHPEAKNYAGEIGKILVEDADVRESKNSLESAYMKILSHRKTPEELVEDEDFLEKFIYVSDKVRDKIIASYLSELNTNVPGVMTKGGETFITPPKSPKNLKEAMNLAEKLLNR